MRIGGDAPTPNRSTCWCQGPKSTPVWRALCFMLDSSRPQAQEPGVKGANPGAYVETADTDRGGRPKAGERQGAWAAAGRLWLLTTALAAFAGCDEPAKAPVWYSDPCDSSNEFERCTADAPTQRWRCDPSSNSWVTIAYCPMGTLCAVAELPQSATAGTATTCVASGSDGGSTADGAITDAVADGDAASDGQIGDAKDAKDATSDGSPDVGKTDQASDGIDSSGGLCGNGVCDKEESELSCTVDCAKPLCGNSQCQAGEASTCPYDCVAGAAAGAACMLAKCPGDAQLCQASATCSVTLAAIWSCAQGCSGCLSKCLSTLAKDPKIFAVAACGAAACL